MDEIAVNKDTCDTVQQKLGTPTVVLTHPDAKGRKVWYYITRRMIDRVFHLPKVEAQQTYVLKFNASGRLVDLEKFEGSTSVSMDQDKTTSTTHKPNLVRDIIRGFGNTMQANEAAS